MNRYRKLLAFGAGVGIEVAGGDLEIAVARVRPSGVEMPGRATIRNFRGRPASEWGAECNGFLRSLGEGRLSATLLVPRGDVIVRHLALPGVATRDIPSAIALQIDTLHPYGEDEIVYGWSRLEGHAVLVAIQRRTVLEGYAELFAEAGVPLAAVTVSAAAYYAALRMGGEPPAAGFLAIACERRDSVEVYGESPVRPVFSAEFETAPQRALALAAAELRLQPENEPRMLAELLPAARRKPISGDDAPAYAAAIAGACPWLYQPANLLPAERRVSSSRALFVPTAVLAGILLLATVAVLGYSSVADRQYLGKLQAEIAKLEPEAARATALERRTDTVRARTRLIDDFRARTKSDLDALNELTRLLPPPVWTNNLEIQRDSATINGEAESAAALLKALDASPLFQNSEFSVIARTGSNELFRIRTMREVHK